MRVGIDISQIVYEGTGSGRYVVELVKALVNDEVSLTLFGSAFRRKSSLVSFTELFSKNPNVRSRLYPFPPKFFELFWNKLHTLPFELLVGDVDVYHSSDWTQAPAKCKKVTTIHDMIPFLFPDYVHPRIKEAHGARWKWIKDEVDCIIVDAVSTKRDIIEMFGLEEARIEVVPLGVDQRFLDVGRVKIVKRKEIKSDDNDFIEEERIGSLLRDRLREYGLLEGKYILAVGTLEPRKNISRLIEAYSMLDSEISKTYPLVIVGKKSWIKQYSIPQGREVKFTGYVSDADLPLLYSGAAVFVMPSLYEGFGLPVLEAMACATPVLACDRSSLPEIGGDTIRYIEQPEEVEDIARNIQLMIMQEVFSDVEKAYLRASGFSWTRTARDTLRVYKKLYND